MGPSEKHELLDLKEYNRLQRLYKRTQYQTLPRDIEIGERYNLWLIIKEGSKEEDGAYVHMHVQVLSKIGNTYRAVIKDVFANSSQDPDFKIGDTFICEARHFGSKI